MYAGNRFEPILEVLVWNTFDCFRSKRKDTNAAKVTEIIKVANVRGIELKLDGEHTGRINNHSYSHRRRTNDH